MKLSQHLDRHLAICQKGLSGNMFSSFKGGQTGRLMVFSGQNWYQRMHFLYAEALVKATCLIIPFFID